MTRSAGSMEISLFTHVIDQVKDYIETIDLDLFGEFEFNPQWAELIRYCSERNLFTVLNTNATMMDEDISRRLINSGLNFLNISFDSSNPELYERIRKGADFDKTLRNIRHFLSVNKKIYTVIQMIHTTETDKEIRSYLDFWKNSGADAVRIKKYIPFDPDTDRLDPEIDAVKKKSKKNASCLYLWKSLVVTQDGTVVPCCVDFDNINKLGDACKESIADIWNGKPMQSLRKAHAEGKSVEIKLCSHCRPLTASLPMMIAGALADDPMRRKIMPFVEKWLGV
ncbi:MAG: SPASM domain-containing protein [Firmicutes bacterium]|nr:SPASM domain-containing protein [Bacillota bacterium]